MRSQNVHVHVHMYAKCLWIQQMKCLLVWCNKQATYTHYTVCSCSKFPREPKLKEYISELTTEVIGTPSDSVPEEGNAPQDTSARQIKKGLCLFC